MNVEERAGRVIVEWLAVEEALKVTRQAMGDYSARAFSGWSAKLKEYVEKGMRELIEECAKVCDEEEEECNKLLRDPNYRSPEQRHFTKACHQISGSLAFRIRALAAPKEGKIEGKGIGI